MLTRKEKRERARERDKKQGGHPSVEKICNRARLQMSRLTSFVDGLYVESAIRSSRVGRYAGHVQPHAKRRNWTIRACEFTFDEIII